MTFWNSEERAMGYPSNPGIRDVSRTLPSDPAPVPERCASRVVAADPIHGKINHRHSPEQGLDILEIEDRDMSNPLPGSSEVVPKHMRQLKGLAAAYADMKKRRSRAWHGLVGRHGKRSLSAGSACLRTSSGFHEVLFAAAAYASYGGDDRSLSGTG